MKLSYLLINVVLVAGGIFVYDEIKSPDPTQVHTDYTGGLTADAPDTPSDDRPAPMTSGGLRDRSDEALADRVAAMERLLSSLSARRAERADDGTGPLASNGGKLPELSATDFIDPDDPVYDEKTLQTIASYMDEINRRKQEERQRNRVASELDRLGLELSDAQQKSVVDETLAYQGKARDLLRQGFARDEDGRTARREAFKTLQDEYKNTINRLVPTAEAEKIANSRIARGMGFYSGRNTRIDGGNNGRTNRRSRGGNKGGKQPGGDR